MSKEILSKCTVEGLVVKLPAEKLDRKVYEEVKKRLEGIGGKWKGGKTQGFVFEQDPTELMAAVSGGEKINLKQEYQFFPTPWKVRRLMIGKLFELNDNMKILEPSAGEGALINALVNEYSLRRIDCFEIMALNRTKLATEPGAYLIGDDFLKCNLKDYYDVVIANPPFIKNQDIRHIAKMYEVCTPGGVIVTLASMSWTFGSQKLHGQFREWLNVLNAETEEIEEGAFKESGTSVATVLIKIIKPEVDPAELPELCFPATKSIANEELRAVGDYVNEEMEKQEQLHEEKATEEIQEQCEDRKCRVCGCTDKDCRQCIKKTGQPCHWVEEDLCSACQVREPESFLTEMIENEKAISKELNVLKQMISPNKYTDMNFFSQLNDLLIGVDLKLEIKRTGNVLKVSALPSTKATMNPITITGAPGEIDAGFFVALQKPLEDAHGLKTHYTPPEKASNEKTKGDKPASKKGAAKKVAPKVENKKTEDHPMMAFE